MRPDNAPDEFCISNVRFFVGDENSLMVALYGHPSSHGDGWIANLGLDEVFSTPPIGYALEEFYEIKALGAHEFNQYLGLRLLGRDPVQGHQDFAGQPSLFIHQPIQDEPLAVDGVQYEPYLHELAQDEPAQHELPLNHHDPDQLNHHDLDQFSLDQPVLSESVLPAESFSVEAVATEPAQSSSGQSKSMKSKSDRQSRSLSKSSLSSKTDSEVLQRRPTRRKELVIPITAGWALFTVFVFTVLGGLLPLQPRNLAWSQNLSRLVVDAGSLALVGLVLVRCGSYLRSLDLPRSSQSSSSSKSSSRKASRALPLDQSAKDKTAMERNKRWVRRFAIAGALGMLLLAPLQVVNFLRGASILDREFTQATLQQRQQFQQLEMALQDAPAERLRQGWIELKKLDPANLPATLPAPATQLDDLLAEASRSRDSAQRNLNQQVSTSRFVLGRDSLRVLLAALVYSWAFWAFLRRA